MMAAQTLETIPEETVVAPAVTPERLTSDAPKQTKPATAKNPGRVASGKRLAERNRLAREAKKKAEAEAAKPAQPSPTPNTATSTDGDTNTEESSSSTVVTILGIGGLVVSALGVYYQRAAIMQRIKPTQPAQPEPAQPEPIPTMSLIPVKRGIREME